MACLDARLMVSDQERSKTKFKRLLENLVTLNSSGCPCNRNFLALRLYECMGQNKTYEKLWSVIRKVLLLSHGQAPVESGFSLNRQIEKDNMNERMLVALRPTDHFVPVGGMLKVEISKELLSSASSARHKYHQYIDEEKRKKGQETIQRK